MKTKIKSRKPRKEAKQLSKDWSDASGSDSDYSFPETPISQELASSEQPGYNSPAPEDQIYESSLFPSQIQIENADTTRRSFFNVDNDDVQSVTDRQGLMFRFYIFMIQLVFSYWNFSTDAFQGIPLDQNKATLLDSFILRVFRGFYQWDAVHFMHIAEHGYVLESSLAFFPLYPMIVRYVAFAWSTVFIYFDLIHPISAYLLTAVCINFAGFIACSDALYYIVWILRRSYKQAILAQLIFVCNPASIFFSAAYSESVYCWLTFVGIGMLTLTVCGRNSVPFTYIPAVAILLITCFARSNGMVNFGYVAFYGALTCLFPRSFAPPENKRRNGEKGKENDKTDPIIREVLFARGTWSVVGRVIAYALIMCFVLFLFLLVPYFYGEYQQSVFCDKASLYQVSAPLRKLARAEGVPVMGQLSRLSWCNASNIVMPSFYSVIQTKYWQVGLFKYWTLAKLPCFLMASPAIIIVLFGVVQTFREIKKKGSFLVYLAYGGGLLPFTLHAVFMMLGAVFVYNTEVLTRMLFSSTPFPYMVLAIWMDELTPWAYLHDIIRPSRLPFLRYFACKGGVPLLSVVYIVGFAVGGTALHAMGLPFT